MAGIEPRGNKVEKSYKERSAELRAELLKTLVTPDLYRTQLMQILNGIEALKIKSNSEIDRLKRMLNEEEGRVKSCTDMADLVLGIVSAFNLQEERRKAEEDLLEAERLAKEELAKAFPQEPEEAIEEKSESSDEDKTEENSTYSPAPGVKVIPRKATKKSDK